MFSELSHARHLFYNKFLLLWLHRYIANPIVLLLAVALAGCAGTGSGLSTSSLASNSLSPASDTKLTRAAGNNDPLLVNIRFPALAAPSAEFPMARSFLIRTSGAPARPSANVPTRDAIATLSKSAYYALELYAELSKLLPEKAVALTPYELRSGADGLLVPTRMDRAEPPPALLELEFFVLHAPGKAEVTEAGIVTFADLITPVLIARTAPVNSPETEGLLAASVPVIHAAGATGGSRLKPARLSFVSYLNHGPAKLTVPATQIADNGSAKLGQVLRIPLEKLQMPVASSEGTADPRRYRKAFATVIRPHVNRIIAWLNQLDRPDSFDHQFAQWAHQYDRNPDAVLIAKRPKKRKWLDKIYQFERRFVTKRASALYENVQNGEIGRVMAQLLTEEQKFMDDKRRLAAQQNVSMAATVGASILSGAASYYGRSDAASLAQTAASFAQSSYESAARLSTQLSATFRSEFASFYQTQHAMTVTTLEDDISLSARNLTELRANAARLYRARAR